MPAIRFAWNPLLVDLRREVCPGARWQRQGRCWMMSDAEAQRFVHAAQARLDFHRSQAQVRRRQLGIAPRTVHKYKAMGNNGIQNNAELMTFALRHRLLHVAEVGGNLASLSTTVVISA